MARGTTKKIASAVKKPGRKATTASATALEEQCKEARQTLLKAKGTRSQYDGHLERGRRLLADVIEQKKTTQAEGTHSQVDGQSDIDVYSHAFDAIPNRYSASVLELFLVQKGLMEGRSLSTTWGIFSAFKDMWKNACGETYRGPYHCDEGTGVVTGNPALSAAAQDMMEVLKNNEGAEGGSRNHASAMTIKDMRKLMSWSYSECLDSVVSHIHQGVEGTSTLNGADVILAQRHLMVRAFATTGITIWTRNFELTKIKRKDIIWNCQGHLPYSIPFDLVSLMNRKGWQRKGEIDGALEGIDYWGILDKARHEYEVYAQPRTPEICMFTHLRAWVSFLEEVLLQWPLQPEEYIFPRVGANGVIYPSDELSYDAVMKMLTWICTEAGLTARYTSHCVRRGGARYRFLFAPLGERWSLTTIRWWGAWAEGESVDTLIHYLLDELTRYEKNHRDALCPIPREANRSFNGDHILMAPVTAAETRELKMAFDRQLDFLSGKVEAVLDKLTVSTSVSPSPPSSLTLLPSQSLSPSLHQYATTLTPLSVNPLVHSPLDGTGPPLLSSTPPSTHLPVTSPSLPPIPPIAPSNCKQRATAGKAAPLPRIGIPDLPRSPDAWHAAIKQWEDPAASISGKALKDWPEDWYSGVMRTITGVKRNIWKVIALEFERLGRDESAFLESYPEASRGAKPLFDVIQRKHEECGEVIGCKSKNGRPKDRASAATITLSSGAI
ncbi:hypothetical protein DFH29DRAFT_818041 [Suillus ampliporus]|nr:hypothetical protein DFH29DRAFT_818041 [Suillus ampliporus]